MGNKNYGLTYPQKNIWLVEKFNGELPINSIVGTVEINRDFDSTLCIDAVNNVIKNNDALRIKFDFNKETLEQYVTEYKYKKFEVVDMSMYSQEKIEKYIIDFALQPLFFGKNCLFDFRILDYGHNKGAILMKIHHIICDAWSCSKIGSQLVDFIEKKMSNEEISDELKPSYFEFVNSEKEYEASDKYKKDEEFWREYLSGIKETTSIKSVNNNTTNANRYSIKLEESFNNDINMYCKDNKISPYVLFLAALSTYIYRIKNNNDLILGTPVLNRSNFREKNMVGMFVSTMPIRIKIEENIKFLDLAKQISLNTLTLFRHQKYPYSKTLEYVHKETDITGNLYNVVLSYQNARADLINKEKYSTTWPFVKHLNDELQIHIMDMDNTGVLNIKYDYLVDAFSEEEVKYLHTRLIAIIKNAISDLDVNVENIRIMSPEEENKILYEFNDTKVDYPKDKTVIELFEEQVKKTPNNIALVYENRKVTYKQLLKAITNFSSKLSDIKNENILVSMDNSFDLIVAIYGILKSGNTYVPVSTSTPIDRIRMIADDCNCKYVVMNKRLLDDVIYLDASYDEKIKEDNNTYCHLSNNAYIIYTSGSTGKPKGVIINNDSLVDYILWAKKEYVDEEIPVMPLYSSIGFDLTVTTLFLPLVCGGRIILCKNDNEEIIKIFREDEVNIVKLTPAHLALINEANIRVSNIRTLILGGEALKSADANKIFSKSKKIRIFNEYGPTEATVGCMIYKFDPKDSDQTVPIGRPADNTQIYILDNKMRLCPLGVEGKMYIQGNCLSVGYNNMEEKNRESFVINNYTNLRTYNTGDIAKLGIDLKMRYIGRCDKQIKINGNRIEIEEIENIAKKEFKFKNVIVDVKQISNIDNICLYYISDKEYDEKYIRSKLKRFLPYYMVPTRYIKIDSIPVNKNGKVERNKLPIPLAIKRKSKIIYKSKFEETVCKVWESILGTKNINPNDSIFDLGVDSLNIIRCQVKLSNYTSVIDVQKFYEFPVIREFCQHINKNPKQKIDIENLKQFDTLNFDKNNTVETKIENIMLIGATGYLGIHILKELLLEEKLKHIYCIVRGIDFKNRLKERFEFYFGKEYEELYNNKVIVINGNIEQKNLGLASKEMEDIICKIDRIINTAAIVKHHGAYSEFEMINVEAVQNIIDICISNNKILDHISTVSIAGDTSTCEFNESKFYVGQNYKINPYIETKFKAELLIYSSIKNKGLKANVYRIGNLTWRFSDGVYQKNVLSNGFFMRMKNILDLGKYPTSFKNMKVEMTPVDIAANFIVTLIIMNKTSINEVYHIYNQNFVNFMDVIEALNIFGNNIEEINDDDFMELLKQYDSRENVLLNDIVSSMGTIEVKLGNEYTVNMLKKFGKKWPIISKEYIQNMLYYIKKLQRRK